MKEVYTALEIAQAIPANYASVLASIQREELPAVKAGGQYIVYGYNAQQYIERRQKMADPGIIGKLEAEIGRLKLENAALKEQVAK